MNKTWQYNPKPIKFETRDKVRISAIVQGFIDASDKIKQRVNRFEVKAGRVYLYHLVEQFGWDNPEARFIIPLIEGKYAEFPLARITMYDQKYEKCTVDWQRHNGQWIVLHEGTLAECLEFIENENTFIQ
jgi:hypothetical protein